MAQANGYEFYVTQSPGEEAQRGTVFDWLGRQIEDAARLPGENIEFWQRVNQDLAEFGQDVQQGVSGAAESARGPIQDTEVRRVGGNVASWLARPVNLAITVVAIVLTFILFRKI